jgi:SRSO17 transposase
VAVSLSLATERGSVPIDWRLYLPGKWAKDRRRRKKSGVPTTVKFLTQPQIALEQIRAAKAAGVAIGIVLADAGYGNETAWREALSEMELEYCVGVPSVTTVWAAGAGLLPPKAKNKIGRPPTRWQRGAGATPLRVKGLAEALTANRWRTVVWREGSSTKLSSRFAALRVRAAHRDEEGLRAPRKEQWLLIEWPAGEAEPSKYWLSTLPAKSALVDLVKTAKMRWRIERDYQELKQEYRSEPLRGTGLAWLSSSRHLVSLQPTASCWRTDLNMAALKKTPLDQKRLAYPKITNRAAAQRTQRHVPDSIATLRFMLARAIVGQLDRCPCCNVVNQR